MNQSEKKLFLMLCDTKFKLINDSETEKLLKTAAGPEVLGMLFFNRMQGIAYLNLLKSGFLGRVNREFRNSVKSAYEQNSEKNRSFFKAEDYLSYLLSEHKGKYAMLKGALLCGLYPEGCRTSNDIDLLVAEKDVTSVGEKLKSAGFVQGSIRNGVFVPASRREIIESKMTRGETIPFIKEVNLPFMRYLEVDINYSLDYKNSDGESVEKIISGAEEITLDGLSVVVPDKTDFFIHICTHLYKEAATLPWVKMNRDMTLYKYCDVNFLANDFSNEEIKNLFIRAEKYGVTKECSFALLQTDAILPLTNRAIAEAAHENLNGDEGFLHTVVSPSEHRFMHYENKDIQSRFFSKNRIKMLKEN